MEQECTYNKYIRKCIESNQCNIHLIIDLYLYNNFASLPFVMSTLFWLAYFLIKYGFPLLDPIRQKCKLKYICFYSLSFNTQLIVLLDIGYLNLRGYLLIVSKISCGEKIAKCNYFNIIFERISI